MSKRSCEQPEHAMAGKVTLAALVVLVFVGEVTCLPLGFVDTEQRKYDTFLLRGAEVGDEDILSREERGLPSGSGSGSGSGMYWIPGTGKSKITDTPLPSKPDILDLTVETTVTARFANTEIRSTLKNRDKEAAEATFTVKLPKEAFISAFSMTIEGVVYHSEVKTKAQAQKEYNAARARGQTAGQVKQSSSDVKKFTVSVTVAANTFVIFHITYQQLLKRKDGMFENRINIQPGQVVADVRVEAHISEPQGIKEVDAHWTMVNKADEIKLNNLTFVQTGPNYAHVSFDTHGDGANISSHGIMGEFVIKYDVMHGQKAGHIEIVNGYFVHYFSPVGLPATRKNVVFVIDISGSMGGRKIAQTKVAFSTMLDDVRPIDTFNIVLFESYTNTWTPGEMVTATPHNIAGAKTFVRRISAGGGTNMYGGLLGAIELLTEHEEQDGLPLIIMLTDGVPTAGEITDTGTIVNRITSVISGRISLFNVGFGSGVDYGFLEKLSLSNQGLARKVYEDSSASVQMKGFYDEVANPLLFNVDIVYNNELVDSSSLTKSSFKAYYDGTEIVVAGKLNDDVINAVWNSPDVIGGDSTPRVNLDGSDLLRNQSTIVSAQHPEVVSIGTGDDINDLELSVVIAATSLDVQVEFTKAVPIEKERSLNEHEVDDFAQRLWAYLSITNFLEQRKTANSREAREALTEKALSLSLKYHFVTPLTSLLIVKPNDELDEPKHVQDGSQDEDEEEDDKDYTANPVQYAQPIPAGPPVASRNLGNIILSSYVGGRLPIASADSDPHFMIALQDTNITICFDINGRPGDVFSLLHDPKLNLSVSASVILAKGDPSASSQNATSPRHIRTYFGQLGVQLGQGRYLVITTDYIMINNNDAFKLQWGEGLAMRMGGFVVELRHKRRVVISHGDNVVMLVMLHHKNSNERTGQTDKEQTDYLGFYVEDNRGLSKDVHGLIGQFQRKREVNVEVEKFISKHGSDLTEITKNVNATLTIDKRKVNVARKIRRIPLTHDYRECWHGKDNGKGLIELNYKAYKLPYLNARPRKRFTATV